MNGSDWTPTRWDWILFRATHAYCIWIVYFLLAVGSVYILSSASATNTRFNFCIPVESTYQSRYTDLANHACQKKSDTLAFTKLPVYEKLSSQERLTIAHSFVKASSLFPIVIVLGFVGLISFLNRRFEHTHQNASIHSNLKSLYLNRLVWIGTLLISPIFYFSTALALTLFTLLLVANEIVLFFIYQSLGSDTQTGKKLFLGFIAIGSFLSLLCLVFVPPPTQTLTVAKEYLSLLAAHSTAFEYWVAVQYVHLALLQSYVYEPISVGFLSLILFLIFVALFLICFKELLIPAFNHIKNRLLSPNESRPSDSNGDKNQWVDQMSRYISQDRFEQEQIRAQIESKHLARAVNSTPIKPQSPTRL